MPLTNAQQNRLERLKLLVTYRVDEYSESVENLNSDDINFGDLEEELHGAARKVLTSVDRQTAFRSAVSANSYVSLIPKENKGAGIIPLPADYLRFVRLTLDGWKTPCNGLLPDNSTAYRLQQHPLHRGTNEKPKAFRVPYFGGEYVAGSVPSGQVYCTIGTIDEGANLNVGDQVSNSGNTSGGVVVEVSDPDYIIIDTSVGEPTVGEELDHSLGDYTLIAKYLPEDEYIRPTHKDAIEAYPLSGGEIEEFVYVPELKAYDMPTDLEDPLVWYATYRMLLVNERFKGAQAAEDEFIKSLNFINTGLKGEEYERVRTQQDG